jgi:hypothetical protein
MYRLLKLTAPLAAFVAVSLATSSSVGAIWPRGVSDLDISSDDISLCADELTFSTRYSANPVRLPDGFVHALGTPWPLNGGVDALSLYGTAADAVAATNPIATVSVPLVETFIDPDDLRYVFTGQATIPTPAGYDEGDQIFVRSLKTPEFTFEAVPLTIGDPVYNCPPVVPTVTEINITAKALKLAKRVVVTLDTGDVVPSSIRVSADNGTSLSSPELYASLFGKSLVVVRFSKIGLNCATTSIVLTATTSTGEQLRGERALTDPRCPLA